MGLCCAGLAFALTQALDAVVTLLVVHFDGLGVGASDAIANDVAAHDDVLVFRGCPADHDAVDQRPHLQGAWNVRHPRLCKEHRATRERHWERVTWLHAAESRPRMRRANAPPPRTFRGTPVLSDLAGRPAAHEANGPSAAKITLFLKYNQNNPVTGARLREIKTFLSERLFTDNFCRSANQLKRSTGIKTKLLRR